jgi:cytidyltransferase-like protein
VYVGGTFDLLHPGHVRLLSRAADLGEVWVSLNTDEFVERYKGSRPVMTLDERRTMLVALSCVHSVTVNTGDEDSRPAIDLVAPSYIVHGDDWTGDGYLAQLGIDRWFLTARGIGLVFFPYTDGVSTSDLIKRCLCRSGSPSSEPSISDTKTLYRFSDGSISSQPVSPTSAGSLVRTRATLPRSTPRGWSSAWDGPPA